MYIKDATRMQQRYKQPYVNPTSTPVLLRFIKPSKTKTFISSSEARKTNPPSAPSRLWVVSSASTTTSNHPGFLRKKHQKTISSL